MTEEIEFLKNVPLFSGLSQKEINTIGNIAHKKVFHKNNIILQKGDEGEALYIILSGRIKVTLVSEAGKEIILAILKGGDFFGEMSLLDNEPRSANVVAVEDTIILTIYRNDFNYLTKNNPSISLNLLNHLSLRLRHANKKIGSLALLDVCGRIANLFLDMAKEEGKGILLMERLTHSEIANMIGSKREVVSRALKCLKEGGYIKVIGNKIILDKNLKLKIDEF